MYTVYLALTALVVAGAHILFLDGPVFATLLMWLLVIKVGLGGLWAFLGHYFKSDEVAGYIGWPAGNPFQKEVAFANLGLGACGVGCFFFRDGFWLATIVFATCFLVGAFTVHLAERKESGNVRPGNAGPVFYADILGPVTLWVLFFLK